MVVQDGPHDKGMKEQWYKIVSFKEWRSMLIDKPWTQQGEERRGVAWYGTRAADLSVITESYTPRYTQTEKMYYPKVEFFLTHPPSN